MSPSSKTWLIYGLALAGSAFLLRWLEYQYVVRLFATEIYVIAVAVFFTALGVWIGNQLTRKKAPKQFERNTRALLALEISEREYQVLEQLAEGLSNREIADRLFVSANTVKTHLARLYAKLDVSRRTQAVNKAKSLRLIP